MRKLIPFALVLVAGLYVGHVTADPETQVIDHPAEVKIVREPGETKVETKEVIPKSCLSLIQTALAVPSAGSTISTSEGTLAQLIVDIRVAQQEGDIIKLNVADAELRALQRDNSPAFKALGDLVFDAAAWAPACASIVGEPVPSTAPSATPR